VSVIVENLKTESNSARGLHHRS